MAQINSSANIRAMIVNPDDISALSLTSADGTQFILKNGMNSCFDMSITGLQPTLDGTNGQEKVSYSVSFKQSQSLSFDITNIRLNVLFDESVKNGAYQSVVPYTISVHYN